MSRRQRGLAGAADAVRLDEVGIAYGIHGDMRLRAMGQPVYARRGAMLRPGALDGSAAPWHRGRPMAEADFRAAVAEVERPFVHDLSRALLLDNLPNISVEGLDLHLRFDAPAGDDLEGALADAAFIGSRLDEMGIDPGRLVCVVDGVDACEPAVLARLAGAFRALGLRVAVGEFGAGGTEPRRWRLLKPGLVRIDDGWFRRLCGHEAAVDLFATLVRRLQGEGVQVMVGGLDTPSALAVAAGCGVDLFQGGALAPASLVGALIDEAPVRLPAAPAEAVNVVRLAR